MDMHNTVTHGENSDSTVDKSTAFHTHNADGQGPHGSTISAFDELARAYRERDRPALAWKKRGGNVIGCFGSDVPEEFLIAAGYLPVRICGDPSTSAAVADSYLEGGFDPLVRAQFARIVDGSYSYLDHLI